MLNSLIIQYRPIVNKRNTSVINMAFTATGSCQFIQ